MAKKNNKSDDIILDTIIQHLGKNATKEDIDNFFNKLTPQDFMGLVFEVNAKMGGNMLPNLLEEIKQHNNYDNNEEGEGEDDEDDDDFFNFSGKLECLPVLPVRKYTLRIKLRGISPSIWRKIEVPSNVKLTSLAEIIITAMEWYNEHLHQFRTKDKVYYATAQKDDDIDTNWGGDFSINQLLKKEKDKVVFEYDFGDSWEHDVVLSKVEDYDKDEPHIVKLISGKRACPPEDCGGVWGYYDLCETMKYPYSKHARELKEWLGYKFDPEEFWLEDVQEEIDAFNL